MKGRKIVLVDDEPNVLESLQRTLRNEGYELILCNSAAEALSSIKQEEGKIDVIISDNKMPVTDGIDLLMMVRKQYPNIVRIMLTGHSGLDDAKLAINQGAVYRFLTKPCDSDDLKTAIKHALAHKDLWEKSNKLYATVERQQQTIDQLESRHPGISKVEKDASGKIVLDTEQEESLDDFMKKYF